METGKTSVTPHHHQHHHIWVMKINVAPGSTRSHIGKKSILFPPLSCLGPVNCNISIHMCARSALIPPPTPLFVWVACVRVRKRKKNVALNKSCPVCLNCSIKTIFVFDTDKEKQSKLTEHRLHVSLRLRGFCCFVLLFFKFCFSLLCRASSSEGEKKTQTRATVPEPRGPQEPQGVPTLMEAWASLEQIAWWGQKHSYCCTASADS